MICHRSIQSTVLAALAALTAISSGVVQAQLGRIEIGQPFPEARFPALKDGRPTAMADFRGKRVLLLVFASW